MEKIQTKNEAIDVVNWPRDQDLATYPEGARDKTLLYCPSPAPLNCLTADFNYLFKESSRRAAEQYWVEIFAYRLGVQMRITVPPAFVAYDSKKMQSGALIEWFMNQPGLTNSEEYKAGGDLCQQYIPSFDRKKGKQHNFETITKIFSDLQHGEPGFQVDWKNYWAKTFTFDALIGNTDRHQDNWGIIKNHIRDEIYITPVFDNGTSLGYEMLPGKFHLFNDPVYLEKYIASGWHHIRWRINDPQPMGHLELLQKFANTYPETRQVMIGCLKMVNNSIFYEILSDLIAFNVSIPLTSERADFMLKLLKYRHKRLLIGLES